MEQQGWRKLQGWPDHAKSENMDVPNGKAGDHELWGLPLPESKTIGPGRDCGRIRKESQIRSSGAPDH